VFLVAKKKRKVRPLRQARLRRITPRTDSAGDFTNDSWPPPEKGQGYEVDRFCLSLVFGLMAASLSDFQWAVVGRDNEGRRLGTVVFRRDDRERLSVGIECRDAYPMLADDQSVAVAKARHDIKGSFRDIYLGVSWARMGLRIDWLGLWYEGD